MNKLIPCGHQFLDDSDIRAVVTALRSNWLTQGPLVRQFEDALCKYTDAKYAVAVSNGTSALHIALLSLGIDSKSEVITSPITFVASANAVIYCGGKPVFADIEADTKNINYRKIESKITSRTRVILPVHFAGHPCDLKEISDIAKKYRMAVVEDACHAFGAKYKGSKIGDCKYSDITVFSFHPIKSITTGEGGAILTNKKEIYERCMRLRHHGIVRKNDSLGRMGWLYDIPQVGFNYRITDLQCALGISQLKKLDRFIRERKKLTENYNRLLSGLAMVEIPTERRNASSAYHLYIIRVKQRQRDELYRYLKENCILSQVNYIPVHLLSYFKNTFGYKAGDFPVAEEYSKECLSLPLFPGLSSRDQLKIVSVIKRFFSHAK